MRGMPPFLVREHSSLPLFFVAWGGVERQSIMILLRALYVVEQGHSPRIGGEAPRNRYRARLYLSILSLLASLVFVSCSGLNFGGTPAKVTPTVGSSQEALSQLHWCGKPLMIFRDEGVIRSEEHTSELQSHSDLVCRLLLEKKKKTSKNYI